MCEGRQEMYKASLLAILQQQKNKMSLKFAESSEMAVVKPLGPPDH